MQLRTAGLGVLISLCCAPAALADTSTPETLSVDGQGSVMITPDQASIYVSVTRFATRPAPALSAVNKRVDAIVDAVEGVGAPASGIETDSVDTSCARLRVGPKGHRRRIRRCKATESVSVTSTSASIGSVIDAATHAGANRIRGPDFSFSNSSSGEIAAENAAVADAQSQANATAAQLGCTVVGVQSVSLNPQAGVVTPVEAPPRKIGAPSPPTTVHPGVQEVDATVAVVFIIAPATSTP